MKSLRWIRVTPECIIDIMKPTGKLFEIVDSEIPDDSKIVGFNYDTTFNTLEFLLEADWGDIHPHYEGYAIPRINGATIKMYKNKEELTLG